MVSRSGFYINNNSVGTTGATSSYVQGLPTLSGNVYASNMTTNNLTVAGQLNVRQYSAQNIIATTTTTYNQLTVNEDLTLNGKLITTGNVGIGKTNPAVALDVVGNVQCTAGYNLNYSSLPTYGINQIGWSYKQTLSSNTGVSTSEVAIFTYNNLPLGLYIVYAGLTISCGDGQNYTYIANGATSMSYFLTAPIGQGNWTSVVVSNIINQTNTANTVKIMVGVMNGTGVTVQGNSTTNYSYYYIVRIA